MSKTVGTIREIWRYPVCSIGGERLDEAFVDADGIDGDRTHLLANLDSGEVASPETTPRWRPALMLSAYRSGDGVTVSSPTWKSITAGPDLDAALSEFMGFRCGIRPIGAPLENDVPAAGALRPRYDIAALHLLTSKSLSDLADHLPDSEIDRRRFRPNLLLESEEREGNWLAHDWASGTLAGTVTEKTKRCGMTMVAQPDLPEDPEILRAIVRQHARCLGVYASVTQAGGISVGDAFLLS